MRILVLAKRQYTGKDLIDDRYGRLFELPERLQLAGHEVRGVALSYRRRMQGVLSSPAGVRWESLNALPFGLIGYVAHLDRLIEAWRPDVVWASSDALHAIAGVKLAQRCSVPVVLDLYDDYESFGITRLPGLRNALRRACAEANGLTLVSHELTDSLLERGTKGKMVVVGNGVPDGFSSRISRQDARAALGLPTQHVLIGTAGALDESRGIVDLLGAFERLKRQNRSVRLLVAGARTKQVERAFPSDVLDLGQLPHHQIPLFLRSLDVGIVCNRDTQFGRACHPQKLVEMVACEVPLVAARVGETARLLNGRCAHLYSPGDADELASRIARQLEMPVLADRGLAATWHCLAKNLESFLAEVVDQERHN